ncbi:hypothetical protein TREMEDRAFT_63485 [Tremella mesenterica DSM 1558]|uniref:uncharacterized protein n=1 Tax=Tremella mesenterica (strain ATCC 24925 / CBS 8224 / DSM 1558 / NBRC 9311 / NRRL Y-6157 / RJB 2259-6 / UBC 559-6) TaxID=578456 RepID=UPI0003F4A3CF|nr:uncharacterized protein TREMEDRAFT_63485 [Tremella mesenterica DSM 1558]EIW68312.1 hypothetical protein TREMEDRAFT_63485 [Tremella mesenterica DSM 1558]
MTFFIRLHSWLCLLLVVSLSVIATPVDTNAARLRRGLPPKAPLRRYNATSTRHAQSKRSPAANILYIQAEPVLTGKRDLSERAGTPHDTLSYTTDPTQAVSFHVLNGAGTEQDMQMYSGGSNLGYIDAKTWNNAGVNNLNADTLLSLYFATGSQVSIASSYGSGQQSATWTIPSDVPSTVGFTYHNQDGTITVNAPFYVFDTTFSGVNQLGSTLDPPSLNNPKTQVTLTWLNSLP